MFENLEAIIDFAINNEIEAVEFYEKLSADAKTKGAREMLKEFANEERKHQRLLERFKNDDIDEVIENYDFKWIPDMKRSNYVPEMEYDKSMTYPDLLLLAMKREEAALKLYNELSEKFSDSKTSIAFFKILRQEEAGHKQKLESLYDDYMAEMGD
ncbi:MAG: ferritin family protein [Desulfobacterales bacterium]|nr:ferritin family protein [Desulfobacterales bacterium]